MTEIKKNDVIEQQRYLSDDLIHHEILTRLPVKSILRFKSVSKQWYSTLSSSNFASFYHTKSPFSHPCAPVNTLFIMSHTDCYLFSYDDDQISGNFEDNLVKLNVDFGVNDNLILTGCCNGLVCLTNPFREYFYLWNPATRKVHKYASGECFEGIDYAGIPYIARGFGYASSVDDYKYVRISILESGSSGQASNIAHIFCLRENKWRKIEIDHDVVFPYGKPMLLNQKIYWAGFSEQITRVIACFDFELEKLSVIKFNLAKLFYLGVMGAPLSESKYDSTNRDEDLIIPITGSTLPEKVLLDTNSQIIGYTRTGSLFATGKFDDGVKVWPVGNRRRLWLVDSSMKPMQCKTLLKLNAPLDIARYAPSLVSPFPFEDLLKA